MQPQNQKSDSLLRRCYQAAIRVLLIEDDAADRMACRRRADGINTD